MTIMPIPMVPISAHAVLRYIERSGRLDLRIWRRRAAEAGVDIDSPSETIRFLEAQGLISSAQINAEISKIVTRAYNLGAAFVTIDGLTYVLSRSGCVITVWEDRWRYRPRKRSVRKEMRRRARNMGEHYETEEVD